MIVQDTQLGSVNTTTPKLVIVEVSPSQTIRATGQTVVGLVAQLNRGKQGEAIVVGSMIDFQKKCGYYDSDLDGYLFAERFFNAGGGLLKISRAMSTGAVKASVALSGAVSEVCTITADSEGTWGKFIETKVAVNTLSTGYVDITIRNTKTQESITFNKTTFTDSNDKRYITTLYNNTPDKFFTLTLNGTPTENPSAITVNLSGGTNGTTSGSSLSDTAYVGTNSPSLRTGIQAFRSTTNSDVVMVVTARDTSTINTALITHVTDLTLSPRRTIISTPNSASVSDAITTKSTINTDKAKLIYGYVKVQNPFTAEVEEVSRVAYDVAMDAQIGYWQSASQTLLPAQVLGVVMDLEESDINQLTANQINPVAFKQNTGFYRVSDYTCSNDPSLKQNTVRKAKDYFARVFYDNLQQFLSKPINETLFSNIRELLNAILRLEKEAQHILDSSVKCDIDNNPIEIRRQNKIRIDTEISLFGNADMIYLFLDASQEKTIVNA